IRVEGELTVVVGRRDGDGELVRSGIAHARAMLVARGAHRGDALFVRVLDRLREYLARQRTAEAHVDDVRAVIGRVTDRVGDAGHAAAAVLGEHLQRHDLRAVGHAGDADAVVGALRDRAGDVATVRVIVEAFGQTRDEALARDEVGAREIGQATHTVGVLPR